MADLQSGDPEKIGLAIWNLAWTFGRDREALKILNERLHGDDPELRRAAAFGLGLAGELNPLVELCRPGAEDDPEVLRTVAQGLGARCTGEPDEIGALQRLLEHRDPQVAQEARKWLRALGLLPRPTRKASTKAPRPFQGRWPTLLRRINELWFQDDDFLLDLPDAVVEQGWLGYPPATPDQIASAEARLGAPLPPSYREFLMVSNGWRKVVGGFGDLLPVESIDWFAARNQDWIDAYAGSDEYAGLQRAILLSDDSDSSSVILLATEVPGPSGECQAWYFASWIPGAMTFPSFEHLMTSASQDREL